MQILGVRGGMAMDKIDTCISKNELKPLSPRIESLLLNQQMDAPHVFSNVNHGCIIYKHFVNKLEDEDNNKR